MSSIRNALTIDVEDWYHPELVRHHLPPGIPERQIVQSTQALLDVLESRSIQATFFVVGEVAQQEPQLIQAIAAKGHEIGCHGMSHKPLWQLSPEEFAQELNTFARLMGRLLPGVEIVGFRAPTFSVDHRTAWALEKLREAGYRYDSSVFPMKTPLYGVAGSPLTPYRPAAIDVAQPDDGVGLVEFPLSVWSWAGLRVPVCGGFYLRALPLAFVQFCLRQISQQRPFVIYLHPWESYAGTPRLRLPLLSRWATYHNASFMMDRIAAILDGFSFAPMRTVLAERGYLM
jgi:peptidoglycan-N-acetylglucosamine deacetylase